MSARRSKFNTKANQRRGKRMIEKLETRVLFNTIITDTNPLTATPATQTLEYKDAKGLTVRIVVHGDVSAEFVFGRETKGDAKTGAGGNQLILGDAVSPTAIDAKTGKTIANTEDGRDLFHVYIAQATIDSYISIAQVPAFDAKARPMQPFTGNVSLIITPNRTNNVTAATDGGTGAVYLGARTRDTAADIQNEADNPVRVAVFNGLGLLAPNAKHRLVAGINTAPGVSIGRFLFGGAISGEVQFLGSVESFYCGALLTGTTEGQTEGSPLDPGNFFVQGDIRNILVKGSIGTDSVPPGAGRAEPHYWAGTDFAIHGRVGQIKTGDDYMATGNIYNDNTGLGLRTRQQEVEVRINTSLNRGSFTEFENGQFGDDEPFFTNDTFDDPQFLGSINSKQTGNNSVQVNGLFQWLPPDVQDRADYYAVPLMAGQKVGVRVIAPLVNETGTVIINGQAVKINGQELKSELHAGVYDPDGQLIASDFSDTTDTTSQSLDKDPAQQELFQFTATKPGIYRFAVGKDFGFGASPGLSIGLEQPYQLQITGVGNLGLGGLVANQTIYASGLTSFTNGTGGVTNIGTGGTDATASMRVVHGDFGAIYSETDDIVSSIGFAAVAVGGDLRAVDAMSLGEILTGGFGDGPEIEAITGSIGMIRTRGTDLTTDCTLFNDVGRANTIVQNIGGNVQYIVAPNTMGTDMAVNGSVGVIQVNQWGFINYAGSLSVNADGKGPVGHIDLIDVHADLGTLAVGGPTISVNQGGDVKYIHISPTSKAFRPRVFGGSEPEETTYVQGQEADITTVSGARVKIVPTQEDELDATGNLITDPNTGEPLNNSGTLTVLTYPIARTLTDVGPGGGGLVIIRATSTRGMQVRASGGPVGIGEILSTELGAPKLVQGVGPDGLPNTGDEDPGPDGVVGTADDPFEVDPTLDAFNQFPDNSIDLVSDSAKHPINVFMIREKPVGSPPPDNFVTVKNRTTGEIVNLQCAQIGTLEGNNLGFSTSTFQPGMAVEGQDLADLLGTADVEGSTYPFGSGAVAATTGTTTTAVPGAHSAIMIYGSGGGTTDAQTQPATMLIRARQAIGNVMIEGRSEEIVANYDGVGTKGVFEGIIGNIFAKGQLQDVRIGEGVLPSGTGDRSIAGIYCISDDSVKGTVGMGRIEKVENQGPGSDIRGDIIANGGIGDITLNGGSIINNDMGVSELGTPDPQTGLDLTRGEESHGTFVIVHGTGANGAALGNIDHITTSGYGGIIGVNTFSANIGPVTSVGGFGVINSRFLVLGDGRFGAVTADGYGARGVTWEGGQSIDGIVANGDGHRLNTNLFEPNVLLSGSFPIDPYTGQKPNALSDLYVVIGTTPASPTRKGTSASGSIDLSVVRVSRDMGEVTANTIRATDFEVPNNIGTISTRDYVDSLILTTGSINTLHVGKDMMRANMEVAGPVGDVSIGGTFKGSSHLNANGDNGSIASFTTGGNLYGNVYAQNHIGTIRVGKSFASQGSRTAGSMDAFITNGDVITGAVLTVEHNLGKLIIGGDLEDGALIKVGTLGTKTIVGSEVGVVDIKPWEE